MNPKIVLITAGSLRQDYVQEFTQDIGEIPACGGHINLFAKDYINFFRKFEKPPQSITELQAFVWERVRGDPENYLFSDQFKKEKGFVLKQVIPFKFLFEFVNSERLGECCYAKMENENPGIFSDIKIFCPPALITESPKQMKDILGQYVAI